MRVEIEKALVLISQNFRNKLLTEQLAKASGLSPFHFHRLFQAETGRTPQKYVEKLRLEHAAHMMALNPEMTKIQLAFESGFSSPAVFSRSFKNFFGKSPSIFQQEMLNPTLEAAAMEAIQTFHFTQDLEITYLSELSISAQLLSPEAHKIDELISQNFVQQAPLTIYGVFLDAPIHLAPQACRYLLGTEATIPSESNYRIESGYYAALKVKGNFEHLKEQVIELHKYLTQQNYRIREPIAIEKIPIKRSGQDFSYQDLEKDMFVPISRV